MNQKFIQQKLLSSLLIGLFAFSSFNANAMGLQKTLTKMEQSTITVSLFQMWHFITCWTKQTRTKYH